MAHIDKARWEIISPLLNQLLDADATERAAQLDSIHRSDPLLADQLDALLKQQTIADRKAFLDGNPLHGEANLTGQALGGYTLDHPIGQGGMGSVWLAHRSDGRYEGRAAIKFLNLALLAAGGAQRFQREGSFLARLAHPHIARLIDAGVAAGGQPYLVLEYVDGEPIDRWCDSHALNIEARVRLFLDVLAAVAHAHNNLVLHRDLKPSNILVTDDGQVKLLDFGVAKLLDHEGTSGHATALTQLVGSAFTPEYAAPEQVQAQDVTTATDVYALGVLLYVLLSGQHPTAADRNTHVARLQAVIETEPLRLSDAATPGAKTSAAALTDIAVKRATTPQKLARALRGDLENIVAKALKKNPLERYFGIAAFSDDLNRYLNHEVVSAQSDSIAYRAKKFLRRHLLGVAVTTLVMSALIASLGGALWEAQKASAAAHLAVKAAESARAERDSALEQQRLLRGNNEFMQLLLRDGTKGDPGAIKRQLDRATELIEQTRFEAPIIKVALMRQTAGRYAELGENHIATALISKAITSIKGTPLSAPNSAVPVNLACSLAGYLLREDKLAESLAELDRADRLLAAGAEVSVPSHVECIIRRSQVESSAGHNERAIQLAQGALRMLEEANIRDGEQHRVTRSAVAQAMLGAGRNADALVIAAPLLKESIASQGRASMAVIARSSTVTTITRAGGLPLAALPLARADAASAQELLGGNRIDPRTHLELGLVLAALGQNEEAIAVLAATASAADQTGVRAIALQSSLARVEAMLGSKKIAEAGRLFDSFVAQRNAAARNDSPVNLDMMRMQALLAIARGDLATAQKALDAAQQEITIAGGASHPLAFAMAMTRAELALAGGNADLALTDADRALDAAGHLALQSNQSSDIGMALLLRARALASKHSSAESSSAARDALRHLRPTLGLESASTRLAETLAGSSDTAAIVRR